MRRASHSPTTRSAATPSRRAPRSPTSSWSAWRAGPGGALFLGASHGFVLDAARQARLVVAEVNAAAPAVLGAPWPADIAIGHAVEVDEPIAVAAAPRVSDVERAIAGHVAALVDDGACVQVGIGSLASAVVEGLRGHRFLGIHSGMMTPALQRLVELGAADNSRKEIDAGVSITACVYGDAALYAAAHANPALHLREPRYTHAARRDRAPRRLRRARTARSRSTSAARPTPRARLAPTAASARSVASAG
jgi:acyl-CoA hydrolase